MPRKDFQAQLDELQEAVCTLGDDVVAQLDDAITAFEHGDEELGRAVIDGDAKINERYLELEADCTHLFALQQPVASDLRFVTSSFKILTDLERIGDLATNFGTYTLGEARDIHPDVDVVRIGRDAQKMVEDALVAYDQRDVAACFDLARRDDQIDALCQQTSEQIVRELIAHEAGTADPWAAERLMDDVSRFLLAIRDVERVADHAVNIAARTLYMVDHDSELLK